MMGMGEDMEINLFDQFGPHCVDPLDGAALRAQISQGFERGLSVTLNFVGVKTLTASFLTPALGCLYADFPPEFITARLTLDGLDDVDQEYVSFVREKAIRYFQASGPQREALVQADRQFLESR